MQTEPKILFRGMDSSPSVEEVLRERIARLSRFHDRISSCSVVVEAPHRHGRKGGIYRVRVDVKVPGREIVTKQSPEENHAHEDVYVAIRDSFDAMQRQLEDVVRRSSGHRIKEHPATLHGKVTRLMPEEGYGFISALDGREFFFRRESVASEKQWEAIAIGTEVRFSGHDGDNGPHATAVALA